MGGKNESFKDILEAVKKLNPAEIIREFELIDFKLQILIAIFCAVSILLFFVSILRVEKAVKKERLKRLSSIYSFSMFFLAASILIAVFAVKENFFYPYLVAGGILFMAVLLASGAIFSSLCIKSMNKIKVEARIDPFLRDKSVIRDIRREERVQKTDAGFGV